MKATAILKEEHQQILRALAVIEQMAAVAESGGMPASRDVEDILNFLRLFADTHHQGKEEMILFPALLKGPNQRNHAALTPLIFAHNQERSIVEGLEDAARTSQRKDFIYFANRLLVVLRAHIEEEDRDLFALTDATLTPQEDEAVAHELADFERHWRETVLTGLEARLTQLEHAYSEITLKSAS